MLNMKIPGMSEPYNATKANQQVNAPSGPKAHVNHRAALAAARQAAQVRVRVEPAKEEYRHVLAHPDGTRFRKEGSAEWPLDRFTTRRLRDGSIKIVAQIDSKTKQVIQQPTKESARNTRDTREVRAEK